MNKRNLTLAALLIVAVGATALFIYTTRVDQEKVHPRRGDVVETIYGLGTVAADRTFNVKAGIAAAVNRVFVTEGEKVKRGQAVVQLESSLLKSPIDGTVTKISFKQGELAAPQVSILTITNLEYLFLEVSLEQQSVLRIKEGQPVSVSFETLRNEKYIGAVKTVYPRENQFIVRIELPRWPSGVLPGMTADAAIVIGQKENVLLVPVKSMSSGKVTRLRNGKQEKISVKLGVINNEWAEVTSDNISETDEIIVRRR